MCLGMPVGVILLASKHADITPQVIERLSKRGGPAAVVGAGIVVGSLGCLVPG
jgi:hypothetical protein